MKTVHLKMSLTFKAMLDWVQGIVTRMYHHFNESWKDGVVFPTRLFSETFDHIFNCEISSSAIVCMQSFFCPYSWINLWTLLVWHGCHATRLQGRILPKCHGTPRVKASDWFKCDFERLLLVSLYSLVAKRLETAPGRIKLWRRDASRNEWESTRFGRRSGSIIHRFCHAFPKHHNDDDEELGETKRVEINQIRKEIMMWAVYRAMDKLRRDCIEEALNPGPYHNDDEDELDDPVTHFDSQDPCEWPRSESGYGETSGCSRHVNNEKWSCSVKLNLWRGTLE